MPGGRARARGLEVGRVGEVAIRVSGPLVAIAILAVVVLAAGLVVRSGALLVVPAAVAVFTASFLAHEAAHALFARFHGLGVESITLRIGGGITAYAGATPLPGARVQIALAGPLASAVLATAFAAVALALGDGPATGFFEAFAGVNLFLTAVNLLPAPRLDGGQVVIAVWDARRRANARRGRVSSTGAT